MAYDRRLADLIRRILAGHPAAREVGMFGGLAFMVNGKLAVSAHADGTLLLRVAPRPGRRADRRRPGQVGCDEGAGRYGGGMVEFLTLTLEQRGPAGAFLLSDEQVAALGGGRRAFPVQVSVNGATLALRVARMGGENMIGLARAAREQAGVSIGSAYEVQIVADAGERTVEVPDDLAAALADDADARAAFEALAYSHRKEFVRWIGEAKREATRAQRVGRTLEMLRAGQHR